MKIHFTVRSLHFRNCFLASVLCLCSIASIASPFDSVRIETIGGKRYIIHKVDAKETLFAIAHKYKIKVVEIVENNPKSNVTLSVGQELKIPFTPKSKPQNQSNTHTVVAKETLSSIAKIYKVSVTDLKKWNTLMDNSISVGQVLIVKEKAGSTSVGQGLIEKEKVVATPPTEAKKLQEAHVVKEKETLFSIAKTYKVTAQQLREWNNLSSDQLKKGQTLFVQSLVRVPEKTETQPAQQNAPTQKIKISENVFGAEEIHETGIASLIAGADNGRKYLAQHKTAKTGSILKVRNEATQREVFVRIIGQLTPTDDAVIKISKSAYDKLGATEEKFKVDLIYYKQ